MTARMRAKTAARHLDSSIQDVLRWAGKPEGNENSYVDSEVIATAQALEAQEVAVLDEQAQSSNHITARSARKRKSDRDKRVKLDFSLSPADRETLREVQFWVDEQIARKSFSLPADWRPKVSKKGSESGTITYQTPAGWVDNVPADEFRQMINGVIAWVKPDPSPSFREQRRQADKLACLSFLATDCRLCKQSIEKSDGPEMAQINRLLRGWHVLPYINHALLGENQFELRFRRMHLLCSLWEETLVDIQLKLVSEEISNDELVKDLYDHLPKVLSDAKQRKPITTEADVYAALDTVLALWEKEETEMEARRNG